MASVQVFSRLKVKAGKEREAREHLLELVKASRMEAGVEQYEMYETTQGGEFLFRTQYASQEEFVKHDHSEHIQRAMAEVLPMLEGQPSVWIVNLVEPVP